MSLINSQESALLDVYNGKGTYTPPANVEYGLHIGASAPNLETGAGVTEPSDANYARVSKPLASVWGDSTGGAPTVAVNAVEIHFGQAASDYPSPITHVVEYEAGTNNVRRIFEISPQRPLATNEIKIPVGALESMFGKVGDF